MGELQTVDLDGVEIMAADVHVFGQGASPPEGETYSTADLDAIATATNEAINSDLKAPLRIGHGTEAAGGWVTNLRRDGSKLVADLKAVPKKLATLIESGALRGRSPEVGPWVSQATGKAYSAVVQGLALLGATPPAFQTLADVTKLYAAAGVELSEERAAQLVEESSRDAVAVTWWERCGDNSPYPLAPIAARPIKTYASEEEAALDLIGLEWEAISA